MKLKKMLIMSFALLSLFAGLNAMSFGSEYYCAPKNFDGYDYAYMYNPSSTVESCDVCKYSSGVYNKCVQSYNQNKARFAAGGCVPITVKNYSFGATTCTVKYLGNEKISTGCSGPDAEKYSNQLQ